MIHCFAGISRSVTITIVYIMHSMSYTLNQAFDFVRRKRANISPNFNFMGQLQDFEHLLLSRSQCRCSCPKTTAPSSFSFAKTTTTSSSATTLATPDADVTHTKLSAVSSLPLCTRRSLGTPKSAPITSSALKSVAVEGCTCPCHNLKSYFTGSSSNNSSSGSSAFSVTSSVDDTTSSSSPQFSYDT